MAIKLPKDPIHDVESGIYKLVGFLSTLIIVGESFISKISKVSWGVKIWLIGALVVAVGWVYISRKQ
jgi:hypothetical protein